MPGVEIHANAVNMLLQGESLRRAGPAWTSILFIILGMTASLLVNQRRPWLTVSLLATAVATYLVLGYLLFSTFNVWVEAVGPVAAAPLIWGGLAFHGFLVERKEKSFVRSTLELYVSPAGAQEVIGRGIDLGLGG